MPARQQKQLSAILSAVVLCAVLPHMLGQWYTVVALLALPLVVSMAEAARERWACVVGAACLTLLTMPIVPESLALPPWLLPAACVWLASPALYALLAQRLQGKQHIVWWGVTCLTTVLTALIGATIRFQGLITDGMAESVCAWIDGLPVLQKPQVLVALYQSGLARLDSEAATYLSAGVKLAGVLGVSPEIQQQLLWSFRTTLEKLLPVLLPELLVKWGLITTLLCTLVRDAIRHSLTAKRQLPPFTEWHMPTQLGRMAMVLMLLGVVQLFTANAAVAQTAVMCRTLGYWALLVQGIACMCSWMKKSYISTARCAVLSVLGMLFLPFVQMLIGVYDQFADPRGLREDMKHDHDDENQGGYDI